MTFHENLIFLSGMFSFFGGIFGILRDEDDKRCCQKPYFPIQIRDICRLSWGLAPPWRLSRGGLAYCGLYFGFLSWNLEVYPQICIELHEFILISGSRSKMDSRILHFETHWHIFRWTVPLQSQRMYFSDETPLLKSCVAGNFSSSFGFLIHHLFSFLKVSRFEPGPGSGIISRTSRAEAETPWPH